MSYCINCGVELDESFTACPLCGFSIGNAEAIENTVKQAFHPSDIIHLHKIEKRRHLWELSGIIAFSGIIVCTIVNYVIFRNISWSLFADSSILSVWIALTLLLLAYRKYYIILPGLLATILIMLFLFDLFSPPVNWFFGIALPVTLSLSAAVGLVIFLWHVVRFRGFNILSIAFLIFSGFCIVTEAFIDKYISGKVDIHWSAIVAASVFPISLILIFIHYRMQKGKSLHSYFHV